MGHVLLARHGETTWTDAGWLQGWVPARLTDRGRTQADALAGALAELTRAPSDMIVLRPAAAADLQRLVQVMTALEAAGFTRLSLVEE